MPENTVSFTRMDKGTAQDYALLEKLEKAYIKTLPERILTALENLEDTLGGYQVTRLEHSLQTATRAPDLMSAHNYVMKKYGYEEKPLESIRHLAGRGAAAMLIQSIDSNGDLIKKTPIDSETHKEMTNDFINYYRKNISGHSTIRKNVISLLEWCKKTEIICAVCTNKREDLAIKLLKEINLYKYFDFIAGADTFEYRKPDPRHLTNILDILGIEKKNTIMLGQ